MNIFISDLKGNEKQLFSEKGRQGSKRFRKNVDPEGCGNCKDHKTNANRTISNTNL